MKVENLAYVEITAFKERKRIIDKVNEIINFLNTNTDSKIDISENNGILIFVKKEE